MSPAQRLDEVDDEAVILAADPLPFLSELMAYDEQLRIGQTTRTFSGQETPLPAELAEVLDLIEQMWPRGAPESSAFWIPALIGRFKIERFLGQGGFGLVYLATDPLLGRQVALKVPRLHIMASPHLQQRFRQEAQAAARLEHRHIVPVYETGQDGPLTYIVLAYCDGPTLANWIASQPGDLSPLMAAAIVEQLADAMHYSHERGVLHRDLKPSNVLLFPLDGKEPERGRLPFIPRIVDFGLAKLAEEELQLTGTSGVIGTPLYMAPEQALAQGGIGPGADIYSLGSILYELICKRPPFAGATPLEVLDQVRSAKPLSPRTLRSNVPLDLETICIKCLQKNPNDRYLTAALLRSDLVRLLQGEAITARPLSICQRAWRWCQHPSRLAEAGVIMVLCNVAIVGSMSFSIAMAATRAIPRPSADDAIAPLFIASAFMVTFHFPLIYAGIAIVRRRGWAIKLGLVSGAIMSCLFTAIMFGVVSNGALLWDDLPGFRVVYSAMGTLVYIQTVACMIAWVAYRALR